ncbi:MAG: response regulator transcription factor [Bacteroidetes bacterium]|jgi:DNA-binding NarL/FixJ family response regulator|nr:response regulator transcription factor [Bacteroidota bacterium]
MIKVALAEDNVFLGQNMMDQLTAHTDIQFKFWAQNGKSLLDSLASGELVDIVIMDIEMPVMDGIEATTILNQQYPHIKIMISTVFDDDGNLFNAIKAGASGYLLKDEPFDKVLESIKEVMDGGAPMTSSIAMQTLKLLRFNPIHVEQSEDFNLTSRETEILEQLCQGLSYNQIANNLIISPKTVRKHIENVYGKLNVHSKVEALKVAQKNRLI